jgi:hypothetical protein
LSYRPEGKIERRGIPEFPKRQKLYAQPLSVGMGIKIMYLVYSFVLKIKKIFNILPFLFYGSFT